MGKVATLQKVEADIAAGKLGIARDRLHGLMSTYPNDMSIRSGLGDVYNRLGYPVEAGRWWFLDENLSEEKLTAVSKFVLSCNSDPVTILKKIRIRNQPDLLSEKAARAKVKELLEQCKAAGYELPKVNPSKQTAEQNWKLTAYGCLILAIAVMVFAVVGVIATISSLSS